MKSTYLKLTLVLLMTTFISGQTVNAFTLSSTTDTSLQGWASREVTFLVNTSNCPASVDVPGIIAAAAAVWNNVATSRIKVSYGGSTTSSTYASPPTVYCETNFQAVTGGDQNGVPGSAAVIPPSAGGNISSAKLTLNVSAGNANIANFSRTLLTIILAHEIGHVLGLGHSQDANALMYYNASAKSRLALAQDDIDGISYLYPRNELGDDQPMGCGLVKTEGNPPSASRGLLVLLLILPLIFSFWLKHVRRGGTRFFHFFQL